MIPITSSALKTKIKSIVELSGNSPVQNEVNPIDNTPNSSFDHYCGAVVSSITDSIVPNTKERLDALESNYNSLMITLTTLAANLTAIPLTSVAGIALAADMITQTANVLSRATSRSLQEAILPPYIDGGK